MTLTPKEWIDKAKEQRKRGRHDEAIVSARHAIREDADDPDGYWNLALALQAGGNTRAAIEAFDEVVRLAPEFAEGWARRGLSRIDVGLRNEGKKDFAHSVKLDPDQPEVQALLAEMYEEDKEPDLEFVALQALEAIEKLNSRQTFRLGVLHHNRREYHRAIDCYRRGDPAKRGASTYFNLGLAYNAPEISQDLDALDAWRQSLVRDPGYTRATQKINEILPQLLALRDQVKPLEPMLSDETQKYSIYLNPLALPGFEAIDLEDAKGILKAKKALLHEIELENGRIESMPGLWLDRSRAIELCDELLDAPMAKRHRRVFGCPGLCQFLQTASLDHFLADHRSSPLEVMEAFDADTDGFADWLSPIFAKQFNASLGRAIRARQPRLVQVLLNGRRWVRTAEDDKCFEAAIRECANLLAPLRNAAKAAEAIPPKASDVQSLLAADGVGEILGLLPTAFQPVIEEAVELVRSMSIAANNVHNDAKTSKDMLESARPLTLRFPSLAHRIDADHEKLDEIIESQRADEAHISFGSNSLDIDREGARYRNSWIPAANVTSVRWGILIDETQQGKSLTFIVVLGGDNSNEVSIRWTSTTGQEEQRRLFGKIVGAVQMYLMPGLVKRLLARLASGDRIGIGNMTLTQDGIEGVKQGAAFVTTTLWPWTTVKAEIVNGTVVLSHQSVIIGGADLHSVDNAPALNYIMVTENYPPPRPGAPTQPVVDRCFSLPNLGQHIFQSRAAYFMGIFVLVLIALGIHDSFSSKPSRSISSSDYGSAYPSSQSAIPSPSPAIPHYIRPTKAPNGRPWPAAAGLIPGYPILNRNGLSSLTVDNSQNNSDVMVKLTDLRNPKPVAVRTFFIPAHASFTVSKIRAGNYDVRSRDLDNGGLTRSESFILHEIKEETGVRFSEMTLTLYKVAHGNAETYPLSEDDF